MGMRAGPGADPSQAGYLDKPLGYSLFPKEIAKTPVHWAEKLGKLVWSKVHKGVSPRIHIQNDDEWLMVCSKVATLQLWSVRRKCGRTYRTSWKLWIRKRESQVRLHISERSSDIFTTSIKRVMNLSRDFRILCLVIAVPALLLPIMLRLRDHRHTSRVHRNYHTRRRRKRNLGLVKTPPLDGH